MSKFGHRIASAVALSLWLGLIFYMSAQNGTESSKLSDFLAALWPFGNEGEGPDEESLERITLLIRKGAHMFEFAVLVVLCLRFIRVWTSFSMRRSIVIAFLFTVCYAASDEFHQTFVEGRCGTPVDVLIDSAGALIALLTVMLILAVKKRKSKGKEKVAA